MRVAAVTGLEAEARIARRAGIAARPSGGVPAQTTAIAESFVRDGAEALVSFGIAGALAPSLTPGRLLVPRAVIDDTGARYPVDPGRHAQALQALHAAGLAVEEGDLLGAAAAAASPARKAELYQATRAVAVDLESHLVARAAARAGKPFLVLRAIADTAAQALPPAAVNGLAPSGKPALGRVLLSIARDPRQVPALMRLAGDTRRALDALGSALRVISL
jgi:hopanoid-associated phosphorylase